MVSSLLCEGSSPSAVSSGASPISMLNITIFGVIVLIWKKISKIIIENNNHCGLVIIKGALKNNISMLGVGGQQNATLCSIVMAFSENSWCVLNEVDLKISFFLFYLKNSSSTLWNSYQANMANFHTLLMNCGVLKRGLSFGLMHTPVFLPDLRNNICIRLPCERQRCIFRLIPSLQNEQFCHQDLYKGTYFMIQ